MKKYLVAIFVITFIMAMPLYAAIDNGLIVYLPFDSANGDTVSDQSGGKHDGTISGGAEITKDIVKVGIGALSISVPDASMEVASFTELEEYEDNSYLFWLYYIEGSNGDWSQIIAKPGSTDRAPGIWMNPGNTGIHYRFDAGNAGFGAVGVGGEGTVFELETWYHIAGVKEGEELRFYVDGGEQGVVAVPAAIAQGAGSLLVGKSGYRAATFVIDDLAVYNRALAEAEILDVMNGGLTTPVDSAGKLSSTWGDVKSMY